MNEALKIRTQVHFTNEQKGRKRLEEGPAPVKTPPGRVPRVARLLALAHRFEELIRQGQVKDYADLA